MIPTTRLVRCTAATAWTTVSRSGRCFGHVVPVETRQRNYAVERVRLLSRAARRAPLSRSRCTRRAPAPAGSRPTLRRPPPPSVLAAPRTQAFAKISQVSSSDGTPSRVQAMRFHEKGWQKRNRIKAERKKKAVFAQLNDALKRAVSEDEETIV